MAPAEGCLEADWESAWSEPLEYLRKGVVGIEPMGVRDREDIALRSCREV